MVQTNSMTPEEIRTETDAVAAEPASASNDGQSASSHPIPDLLKLESVRSGQAAMGGTNAQGGPRSPFAKMRMGRYIPGGAVQ